MTEESATVRKDFCVCSPVPSHSKTIPTYQPNQHKSCLIAIAPFYNTSWELEVTLCHRWISSNYFFRLYYVHITTKQVLVLSSLVCTTPKHNATSFFYYKKERRQLFTYIFGKKKVFSWKIWILKATIWRKRKSQLVSQLYLTASKHPTLKSLSLLT